MRDRFFKYAPRVKLSFRLAYVEPLSQCDYYIALEFIAALSAFPDGSSCFTPLSCFQLLDLIYVLSVLFSRTFTACAKLSRRMLHQPMFYIDLYEIFSSQITILPSTDCVRYFVRLVRNMQFHDIVEDLTDSIRS